MIKAIKYGRKRRTICDSCGALLEFEQSDIRIAQVGLKQQCEYILCPACREDVALKITIKD